MTFSGALRALSDVVDDVETTDATVLDADLGSNENGVGADLTVSTPLAPGYADHSSISLSAVNASIGKDGSLLVDLTIDVPDEAAPYGGVEADGGLVSGQSTQELTGTPEIETSKTGASEIEFPARFAYAQLAWLFVPLFVLSGTNVALELVFVTWFAGFLVISELIEPLDLPDQWRTGLRVFTMLGLLGVCYVAVDRLLDVLPV